MILTNSKYEPEDPDTGLHVDWLRVQLGTHEFLDVLLPSGHRLTVFHDHVRALEPGEDRHKDGLVIWKARKKTKR